LSADLIVVPHTNSIDLTYAQGYAILVIRMFVKEITKQNRGYARTFVSHRLMESYRTPRGPRQRKILDLGQLALPKGDWKILADRIEELLSGQQAFTTPPDNIETLAHHYAQMIRQKEMRSIPEAEKPANDWQTVDLNSFTPGQSRTIGGEALGYDAFQELDFPHLLAKLGLSPEQIQQAGLLIIGRLLHPGSERETAIWGKELSGLDEMLGTSFEHLANNTLYRLSDRLLKKRDEIEEQLVEKERNLYQLKERIILYDLTNTFLEGNALTSTLAKRGHSKEKRSDCPLLTLALVVDEEGFPKRSRILKGNVSEPGTLKDFLEAYEHQLNQSQPLFKERPVVVVDAGIGTGDNLKLIRSMGFHYLTVSRRRPQETLAPEELEIIKQDKEGTIRAKKIDLAEGALVYCESSDRALKENSMKSRFEGYYEDGLQKIFASLSKKKGIKKYGKVMERLGRLHQKYPTIAHYYQVDVQHDGEIVNGITWKIDREEELRARFSGSYYLRSSRSDLDAKELWSLYMMLNRVEDSFRYLKSDLGLRPVYHQKDKRMEGHLFISVLAYHLLANIQKRLMKKEIYYRWDTIRTRMSNQTRVTTSITNEKGERIHIRATTDPEPFHFEIYRALGLPFRPLTTKRSKT
jgi:transposase